MVFSLDKVSSNTKELNKDNVLKMLSEVLIFEYYFEQKIDLKQTYKNPLREDPQAGCRFFIGRNDKLLFIDFSRKNSVVDCFGFICKKYNCDLYKALQIVNRDFGLGFNSQPLKDLVYDYSKPTLEYFEKEKKEENKILCRKRQFSLYDLRYWQQFGITLDTLKKFNVIPVQTVFLNNKPLWRHHKDNPIYCYNFPNEGKKKIYRPLEKDKKYRFLSSASISCIYQGFDQLPEKGDLLIITKSMKDVMTLYEFGYNAIAPNSENFPIPLDFYDYLMDKFDNIILFYDNDEAGIEASKKLNEEIGIPYILIPKHQYVSKDISDFLKTYGEKATSYLLFELLGL